MAAKPSFIEQWKLSPRFMLGISIMSLPIAYIVKKHMDWKPNPDSKKRMLIHHLVFWSSGIPALKFLHKTWGEIQGGKTLSLRPAVGTTPAGSSLKATGWLIAAAGTMIAGFEGGERLAKYLVPKKPKPTSSPAAPLYYPVFNPPYSANPPQVTIPIAYRPLPLFSYYPTLSLPR